MSGTPPKLLRDVFFDDAFPIEGLLALHLGLFALVFGEVGNVFRVDEVFFAGIWWVGGGERLVWGACICIYIYVSVGEGRATYSHRGISRNDGFHTRTRRRRGGLVRAG